MEGWRCGLRSKRTKGRFAWEVNRAMVTSERFVVGLALRVSFEKNEEKSCLESEYE
jgi:hypothetical protein